MQASPRNQPPLSEAPRCDGISRAHRLLICSLRNASEFERHFVQLEVWRNIHPAHDRDEVLLSKAAVAACQVEEVQLFHTQPAVIN